MKIRFVVGLGFTLLAGCASSSGSDEDCLPGDVDCADDSAFGGKADAPDFKNDPERMSHHLNYRLAELPMRADLTVPAWKDRFPDAVGVAEPAWTDTYWPTYEGSHNARWQGATIKSPLEKYDAAFNNAAGCDVYPSSLFGANAKAEWDAYYQCAGPAAKWQAQTFQGGGKLHDGIDNDHDGKTDEEGDDGIDGIATWWGTCHAWTPAALMMPEPQHAVVMNGVQFEVSDIKALLQNVFDQTSAVMLGGRCNSKEIHHDVNGSANDECSDVNPGSMHVVLANFLGDAHLPLIEDRTANFEVWNQPVVGFEVTQQNKVDASAANQCVGATGSEWKFNASAVELYDVRTTVKYITEGFPTTHPTGFHSNIRTDHYHYILEIGSTGKIIGGRYCSDGENNHVDFLWSPTGSFNPSNPSVDTARVKELLAKAVAADAGGGGPARVFTAAPNAAIPDNDAAGVAVDVPVTGVSAPAALTVSVDIQHTYRGDLVVELRKDGQLVKTLSNNEGGSQDDLVQSYVLTTLEVGTSPNGTWTLHVTDTAAQDSGTVRGVKLEFR
jgi:transglutaminase elicitor/proprotein convertase P-domain-containing protein